MTMGLEWVSVLSPEESRNDSRKGLILWDESRTDMAIWTIMFLRKNWSPNKRGWKALHNEIVKKCLTRGVF